MAKRRKTRNEKIILQLKRALAKNTTVSPQIRVRQEAISVEPKIEKPKEKLEKKTDSAVFFYDPALVKKDLIKTLVVSSILVSLELVLYFTGR